ncbi:MAG: 50S ribosomal protein L3 [Verrucomicrobia bacterium]|nr:50S ribosomal protein L3 [Verrucomicrobiota bacterium]
MSIGLIGKKLGMTRVYDAKGNITPVTVIAAGGNVVLQRKTVEKDGYAALQVGFDAQKPQRVTKPEMGHFQKAGSEPKKCVREFRTPDAEKAGDGEANLSVAQFAVGDFVDVCGQSKGKGFMGVMRKHNFHGQGAAHGSKTHRRNGAIGCRSTPGRIFKNQGMPGHMGDEKKTVQNLVVEQVREAEGVILVKGAVPGANGCYVVVRPAKKKLHLAAKAK